MQQQCGKIITWFLQTINTSYVYLTNKLVGHVPPLIKYKLTVGAKRCKTKIVGMSAQNISGENELVTIGRTREVLSLPPRVLLVFSLF